MTTTVTITRAKQYKTAMRNERYAWKWTYTWTADDGSDWVTSADGRRVNIGAYGPGLSELRSMLRRNYADLTIIEAWKI